MRCREVVADDGAALRHLAGLQGNPRPQGAERASDVLVVASVGRPDGQCRRFVCGDQAGHCGGSSGPRRGDRPDTHCGRRIWRRRCGRWSDHERLACIPLHDTIGAFQQVAARRENQALRILGDVLKERGDGLVGDPLFRPGKDDGAKGVGMKRGTAVAGKGAFGGGDQHVGWASGGANRSPLAVPRGVDLERSGFGECSERQGPFAEGGRCGEDEDSAAVRRRTIEECRQQERRPRRGWRKHCDDIAAPRHRRDAVTNREIVAVPAKILQCAGHRRRGMLLLRSCHGRLSCQSSGRQDSRAAVILSAAKDLCWRRARPSPRIGPSLRSG